MLVLTRREGEEIVISDGRRQLGVVRIVDIQGDKVRLGFDGFDRSIRIDRRELHDAKAAGPHPPRHYICKSGIYAGDDFPVD